MKKILLVSVLYTFSLICMVAVLISRIMNGGIQWGGICITLFIMCFGTWGYFTLCRKYMKAKGADR